MNRKILFGLFLGLLLSGCKPEKRDIVYNEDQCHKCSMTITDQRYGAELVTKKGKVFTFDSIECLAKSLNMNDFKKDEIASIWITDFEHPGILITAESGFYLHSEQLPSPMGMFLTGFSDKNTALKYQHEKQGTLMTWNEILDFVKVKF